MTPKVMRQLWSLIEVTQTHILLSLDDASLVQWLAQQLGSQGFLNTENAKDCADYINARLPLIRDIAQDRQCLYRGASHC